MTHHRTKSIVSILLAVVLTVSLFAGCTPGGQGNDPAQGGPAQQSTDSDAVAQTISIGTIFPRSGPVALLGEQAQMGAEVARQIFNERGGLDGAIVEFVTADAPDPAAASTEANRLINQHDVSVIIGSLTSGNANAIRGVTERNNVLLWETSGIADAVTEDSTHVFRTCDRGGLRGYHGMRFIAQELSQILDIPVSEMRVALINEDSSFGESLVTGAEIGAAQYGVNVVIHERYSQDLTDHSAMVLRVRETNPHVIFAISHLHDAVLFYDTLMQLNAVPLAILGGGAGFTDPNFNEVFGEQANGVFAIDMPTNVDPDLFANQETVDLYHEFVRRYLEMDTNSDYPPLSAAVVFMGTWVLLNYVLPEAASMDVDDIIAAARGLRIDETTMGWYVEFDEEGQNIGANSVVGQWQDGRTVTVWPDSFALGEIMHVPLS